MEPPTPDRYINITPELTPEETKVGIVHDVMDKLSKRVEGLDHSNILPENSKRSSKLSAAAEHRKNLGESLYS